MADTKAGRLTRREFMKHAGVAGMAGSTAGMAARSDARILGEDNRFRPGQLGYAPEGTEMMLPLVTDGRAQAVIVLGDAPGPLAKKAVELLQDRIEQRTGVRLPVVTSPQAGAATSRIVIATPESGLVEALGERQRNTPSAGELGDEGFFIETSGRDILLLAREGRGMIYAAGRLLHTAHYFAKSMFAAPPQGLEQPVMPARFLHITPHAHTFFEVKDAATIGPIVEELALWGLNGLSIEIEEGEFNDPFDSRERNPDGRQTWFKAKGLYQIGRGLGLKLGLVDSANDPYKNQVTPEIAAKGGVRYNLETLANPTIPAARALLLRNKENLYRDLERSGLWLDNALWFAYDTGGCFDKACQPWIITFLKLVEDLAAGLQEHNPHAQAYVTDWLTDNWEGDRITDYLNQHPQTRIAGVWKQDRSAMQRYAQLDRRFNIFIFLDVTMVGGWGNIGAQPFPAMVSYFVGDGARRGITGLMIYTEGIYDDFNKAMAAQVAWNPSKDAGEFAREYASYFFGSPVADDFCRIVQRCERGWEDPRVGMGQPSPDSGWLIRFIDDPIDAEELQELMSSAGARLRSEIRSSWRWQVFEYRARIGSIAARLWWPEDFRRFVLQGMDAGVPASVLKGYIEEKQEVLGQYQTLVTKLRERVYQEPADRIPSNRIDDGYMIQTTQVDALKWREVLNELSTKVDKGVPDFHVPEIGI